EKLWRRYFEIPEFRLDEHMGLSKMAQPFSIAGVVSATIGDTLVSGLDYVAVPPSAIATLPPPAWLLLVENWTTFVRQAGLRQVGGLVVFTGGFPSVAWSSAFSRMISR